MLSRFPLIMNCLNLPHVQLVIHVQYIPNKINFNKLLMFLN
uniref:Uncharacterized protein n=1 Tax=Anguilla anguilla TaxID=7936 RepID=A0A0E9XTL6_ANGAN